jgi:hypothetical protein
MNASYVKMLIALKAKAFLLFVVVFLALNGNTHAANHVNSSFLDDILNSTEIPSTHPQPKAAKPKRQANPSFDDGIRFAQELMGQFNQPTFSQPPLFGSQGGSFADSFREALDLVQDTQRCVQYIHDNNLSEHPERVSTDDVFTKGYLEGIECVSDICKQFTQHHEEEDALDRNSTDDEPVEQNKSTSADHINKGDDGELSEFNDDISQLSYLDHFGYAYSAAAAVDHLSNSGRLSVTSQGFYNEREQAKRDIDLAAIKGDQGALMDAIGRREFWQEQYDERQQNKQGARVFVESVLDVKGDIGQNWQRYGVATAEMLPGGIGTTAEAIHHSHDIYNGKQTVAGAAGIMATEAGASYVGGKALKFAGKFGSKVINAVKGKIPTPKADPLLAAPKMADHHIFPQQFKKFFEQKGIDIEQHTISITTRTHLKAVHGKGLELRPGRWNSQWSEFIKISPDASTKEVYQFAGKLLDDYNLSHINIHGYRK